MKEHSRRNPWLGLESYKEGEVLYGRDDDIRDLIQCVLNDVDTLLYGKSGIGKSSILNAGILPAARRSGYLPIGIRLSHKDGDDYLTQIRDAILASMMVAPEDKAAVSECMREVVECKDSRRESLYEYFHRHTFHDKDGRRVRLLIIFDQFEEIFTLQTDEPKKRAFFAQMADLLNDIMPSDLQQASGVHSGPKELVDTSETVEDDIFDDIDIGINSEFPEYVSDNDIHFVFTIREDFLSEFEYYTASIPSLKQNRYGLRPINEEQASQIILRPEPGLISPDVAKLIIEKVTGRTDFKLDGIPEIEVDSAVLSLYLNRLYDSKGEDGITASLIEQKGEEIISGFYNEAISSISRSSIEFLEDKLINGQGRRDNVTVYDAINKGNISKDELNILCHEHKILRSFYYAGVLRIEYIHDILCPVVIKHRENRIQRKLIEEESKKLIEQQNLHTKKLKKRNRIVSAFASILLLVSLFSLIVYLAQPKITNFTVLLSEDNSINLTDYWKARVIILSGHDTICAQDVDKSNPMLAFEAKDIFKDDIRCDVNFLIGDFTVGQIQESFYDNNCELTIPIANKHRTIIRGKVISTEGPKAPIYNALVIVDDQLAKTNYKGEFYLYVDSILQDSTIIIKKKGYKTYEGKLQDGVYRLNLTRRSDHGERVKKMHERLNMTNNLRTLEGYFYGFENKDTVRGKAHMVLGLSNDSIFGYTYYNKSYDRVANKTDSYFLIDGKYNTVNNTFKLHLVDAVYNEIEYTGHVTDQLQWYGEAYDKNTKMGYFMFE